MIYRAIRICSNFFLLNKEFKFIKRISIANGYPSNFIDQQIRITLNRDIEQREKPTSSSATYPSTTTTPLETHKSATTISPTDTSTIDTITNPPSSTSKQQSKKKETLLIDIPYVGRPIVVLGKRLIKITSKIHPQLKLQPIPRPPPAVRDLLPQKDPIPKDIQSHLVYEIKCQDCNAM
jgi:hypothetical protein